MCLMLTALSYLMQISAPHALRRCAGYTSAKSQLGAKGRGEHLLRPAAACLHCAQVPSLHGHILCRDFVLSHYHELKKANPKFPILIRECGGVQAQLVARYGELVRFCSMLAVVPQTPGTSGDRGA